MTIAERLHNSKTHKKGSDPNCPICRPARPALKGIIARLRRCAAENQREPADNKNAHAVAGEQWRMVEILKRFDAEHLAATREASLYQ